MVAARARASVSMEGVRMDSIVQIFAERGDLAHLALFLWAAGASLLLAHALRELAAAARRYNEFVRELARFNARHK
jgi:hypothetical protein